MASEHKEENLATSGIWEIVKGDRSMNSGEGESDSEMVPLALNDREEDGLENSASPAYVTVPSAPEIDAEPAQAKGASENAPHLMESSVQPPVVEEVETISDVLSTGDDDEVNVGASVTAGAVTGLLLGGPFLSLIAAFGASVYVRKEGAAGDVVRAGGDIALAVRDRAQKINEKHDLVRKAKDAARDIRQRFCEYDEEHNILQTISNYVYGLGSKVVEFERNHHLVENVFICISRGVARLADKLNDRDGEADDEPR